ncbi:unnamed protein product [Pleuronectes platessa]|uniref:Uncharacterized protein n=1 Tax=Pleuronectes platessa TaxID=8262 RepID=A0A9N7Y9I4_PLEPL|nr:unnamed protein product [Pleuronectes platessa]
MKRRNEMRGLECGAVREKCQKVMKDAGGRQESVFLSRGLHSVVFVNVTPVDADSSLTSDPAARPPLQPISRVNCWCLGESAFSSSSGQQGSAQIKNTEFMHPERERVGERGGREGERNESLFVFIKNSPPAPLLLALLNLTLRADMAVRCSCASAAHLFLCSETQHTRLHLASPAAHFERKMTLKLFFQTSTEQQQGNVRKTQSKRASGRFDEVSTAQ